MSIFIKDILLTGSILKNVKECVSKIYSEMLQSYQNGTFDKVNEFIRSLVPENGVNQSIWYKFVETATSKADPDVGAAQVLMAQCLYYCTSFVMLNQMAGDVRGALSNLSKMLGEFLRNGELPQSALRYYAFAFALCGEPSQCNVQSFQAVRGVAYNQIRPQELKFDLVFEYAYSLPVLQMESIFGRFSKQFQQYQQQYQKTNRLFADTQGFNPALSQQVISCPFGDVDEQYGTERLARDISASDYAALLSQLENWLLQARVASAEDACSKNILNDVTVRQLSPECGELNALSPDVFVCFLVEQIQALYIAYQFYYQLEPDNCLLDAPEFLLHRVHAVAQEALLGRIDALTSHALNMIVQLQYKEQQQLQEQYQALINAFLSKEKLGSEALRRPVFQILSRIQAIQSLNKLVQVSHGTVDFTVQTGRGNVLEAACSAVLQDMAYSKLQLLDILQLLQTVQLANVDHSFAFATGGELSLEAARRLTEARGLFTDHADVVVMEQARQLLSRLESGQIIQPFYYQLIMQTQPQKLMCVLQELLILKTYIEGTSGLAFRQSEDLGVFKIAFQQNQVGFLRVALEYLNGFFASVLDAAVYEALVVKTALVCDYTQPGSAQKRVFPVPFWALLLEILGSLTVDEGILEPLCQVLQRCKAVNAMQFFAQILSYQHVFCKLRIVLLINKPLAGSVLSLLKGWDAVFESQEPFFKDLRRVVYLDLLGSSQIAEESFYLEKMFDLLADSVLVQKSNQALYAVAGRELDAVMYRQFLLFAGLLKGRRAETERVQSACLRVLIAYLQNSVQETPHFSGLYGDLCANSFQLLSQQLQALPAGCLAGYVGFCSALFQMAGSENQEFALALTQGTVQNVLKGQAGVEVYQECMAQLLQVLNKCKELSRNGARVPFRALQDVLRSLCALDKALHFDAVLPVLQVLETSYFQQLLQGERFPIQEVTEMGESAARLLQEYCRFCGYRITAMTSFEVFQNVCLLLVLTQFLTEEEMWSDMADVLCGQLGFLKETQVDPSAKLSQYLIQLQMRASELVAKRSLAGGDAFNIRHKTPEALAEHLLAFKETDKKTVVQTNTERTSLLEMHARNEPQAEPFFSGNTRLLSALAQAFNGITGRGEYDGGFILGQKLLTALHLNFKQLQQNQFMQLSLQQSKRTCAIRRASAEAYLTAGGSAAAAAAALKQLWE